LAGDLYREAEGAASGNEFSDTLYGGYLTWRFRFMENLLYDKIILYCKEGELLVQ
jgi:hypothetical protein